MPVFSGKLADVFGKIWACFFVHQARSFCALENTFTYPHIFPSSAQYTFSANRKTYIFCSLAQHTFFTHRYNTLLLPIARHTFLAR